MRIAITGAAGRIGKVLREGLRGRYDEIRLVDHAPIEDLQDGEAKVIGRIQDVELMREAFSGCEAVVHLAGIPDESDFEAILDANIRGTYSILEAARLEDVKRIVFASTNHAIGFYPRTEKIDETVRGRPDTYYGASKAYGEDLCRLYHDKWGLEVVNLRIGSFREKPSDRRQLSTWLSYPDAVHLADRAVRAPDVGYRIVYGVSNNSASWWDNDVDGAAIGYEPQDSADSFHDELVGLDEQPPGARYQGGEFVRPSYTGGLG